MTNKIKVGAVAYRQKNRAVEWFLVKSKSKDGWEIPKSDTKSGESSVRAAIRFLKDNLGINASVVDEAARGTATFSTKGAPKELSLIYYLMKRLVGTVEEGNLTTDGKWLSYGSAYRNLRLAREQKVLKQANILLKKCAKTSKSQ